MKMKGDMKGEMKGMSWMEALKSWNKKKGGKYMIPKKGSKEYNEIKEMKK